MNKKIITTILLLVSLAMLPISGQADYPTGDPIFSDDIIPDAEFEWTITELSVAGTYYSTDYNYLDQIGLSEGNEVKAKITLDPDTVTNPLSNLSWYDLYVNDVKVNDNTNVSLGYIFYPIPFGLFISPTQYQNVTGTYDLYTQLAEEFDNMNGLISYISTEVYTGITEGFDYSLGVTFSLEDNVFQSKFCLSVDERYSDPENDDEGIERFNLESVTALDINTGAALEYRNTLEYEDYIKVAGNVTIDEKGHYRFRMLAEGYNPDPSPGPFSWAFSILGLFVFGVVVFTVKRKRK